ncbi:MAG: type II toxin-antitoxin system Phd/YefM family antitoxin [Acidobacteriaceae bacterium]
MLNLEEDIRSLSDFRRNTSACVAHVRETRRPLVLTLNGRAALVTLSPEAYQELVKAADYQEAAAGIREGLADVAAGRTKPASDAIADIQKRVKRRRAVSH